MYSKEIKKSSESSSGWILLPEQMDVLSKKPYIYNATAGSFLELLFLQKFWMWLVKFVPMRIAPCVLTCLGLAVNLGSCLTLLYFSPDARTEAPAWAFLLCAAGVFLYQTLDALDGKQAMKVQDTQIEEVYDHGCDAISTVFVGLTTAAACQLGNLPLLMFSFFLLSMLAFYTTHWQDHVTHIMIFGKVDVSEAQFTVILIHLLTAVFGQHIWRTEVLFGLELRMIVGMCTVLSLCGTIIANMGYILGNKTPLDDFIQIPRKKTPQIWNPLIPVSMLTFFAAQAYNAGLFDPNPSLFVIAFGFAYAKLTVKLVITNVTYADMDLWDSSLVAPLLLCLNTYLPSVYMLPPSTALLCGLVYNLMDVARYFTYISWDLREALDVWIFSLKYPPGHPKFRRSNQGVYVNGLNNNEVLSSSVKNLHSQQNGGHKIH
ncbi:cholinephosphotransferase 1-like [Stegodyphus dumicola]|uniref:cholinephosphotransferase 1-like n=1 Tax=Stegodyphus dumicola TaxID=202533 RepID=UPI0015B26926|nr:cholinephosphotransferase 1-like [Stegodyphus dumicola]XP_035230369.1 cholinephosphotransferase 1-like [Stegodyphus dumicola]